MQNREYTLSNGLVVKTKNAKNSWQGCNEWLHQTRRDAFWLEYYGEPALLGYAKMLDPLDAIDWINGHGYDLPEYLQKMLE